MNYFTHNNDVYSNIEQENSISFGQVIHLLVNTSWQTLLSMALFIILPNNT